MAQRPDIAARMASTRGTKVGERPKIDIAERHPEYPANWDQAIEQEGSEDESTASLDGREDLQKALIASIIKHGNQQKSNDMAYAAVCRDRRLYVKGVQYFYWNGQSGQVIFEAEDDSPYDRTFNIFQAYAKIFEATFLGAKPKVEPEADNPFESQSVQDTDKARDYERIWRKRNDIAEVQLDIARLFFTDGRVITETEQREDGEYTILYGGLESRLSGFLDKIEECTLLETEREHPMVAIKQKYGRDENGVKTDVWGKLNAGAGDAYFRAQRVAVRRVSRSDNSVDIYTGEDSTGMCTITKSRVAPAFFEHLKDNEAEELREMFPDGLMVVRNGDTYLESYPYSITNTCDVVHAIKADGMNGPAIGSPLMDVQDSVNTAGNLVEETFDHGIPITYYDQETNIDTLNTTRLMPGGSRKMQRKASDSAADHFYTTQSLEPSNALMNYLERMQGTFAQFVTGQQPALFGQASQDQKTASGYAQMRDMALGQMAIVWKPFTSWYTREMTRCCKLASMRTDDITSVLEPTNAWAKRRPVRISPSELKGMQYTNASDDNFPQSYTDKRNVFMGLMQDPDTKQWLMQSPDNLYLAKQLIGLPELTVPGEDPRNKQLQEISEMADQEPIPQMPDQSQVPMLPGVGQAPIQFGDPRFTWVSSIEVTKYDVDETELTECLRWINSTEGQQAKRAKPMWYQNVCLHADAHEEQMKQKAAANAPPPEQKPPSVNIAIPVDKFAPDVQAQMLAMVGIQVQPGQPITQPQPTGATA